MRRNGTSAGPELLPIESPALSKLPMLLLLLLQAIRLASSAAPSQLAGVAAALLLA
jgi:hypothetical protein